MNPHVNTIASRLSLRPPQRTSLEILAQVCGLLPLEKGADAAGSLALVRSAFPEVTDFEREFPSLCFALATGVGKTRLMGAFIAYLHLAEGIRHFFVLAPNLTIYNKLVAEFKEPNHPKYVFQGIAEFATDRPEIITGDDYEQGRGIRRGQLFDAAVHVNIFNVGKIMSTATPDGAAKSTVPRVRRLHECLGQPYFEYLAKLDDLVLLMDESHRYRASGAMKAIGELRPILGLELTATPQVERASATVPFKNVVYNYPLSQAMADGFVKEPAVATRKNFDAAAYEPAALERLKLDDGIRIHEDTKVHLDVYSRETGLPVVKPFVLVVARDVEHATALVKQIEDPAFFGGRYKGKVIRIDSALKGDEKDENVEQLIGVERADNPTEIVVHVNMLKEGWDVTNLYTIVPLRKADSKTLVEQSIGRGLRLPYGKRTGVAPVDCLTIVAHDRFQEILDYARSPGSIVSGIKIVEIPEKATKGYVVPPAVLLRVAEVGEAYGPPGSVRPPAPIFTNARAQQVAVATLDVIREFGRLPRSTDLTKPEIQRQIVQRVEALTKPKQSELPGIADRVDVPDVVARTSAEFLALSIDIPRVVVQPVGSVSRGYREFTLDLSGVRLQPVETEILIQELQRRGRRSIASGTGVAPEDRLEDYLVRGLMDCDDICYDDHSALLYALAGQVVAHLRGYLEDDEAVKVVLQYHQPQLVALIHAQMQAHYDERDLKFEGTVTAGFTTLRPVNPMAPADEVLRDVRVPVANKKDIRQMLFGGFRRCLYWIQKFHSDPERVMACVLEGTADVKWFRPAAEDTRIHLPDGASYTPDFVVEAKAAKYLIEVKERGELEAPDVKAKARAAVEWCKHATAHELKHGGKPWSYLLIPDDVIAENKTLAGLAAAHTVRQ